MACVAAFEEMLAAPEIAAKGYEVSLMALSHNGWDESHTWCLSISRALRGISRQVRHLPHLRLSQNFGKAGASAGVENQSETLTTHSITKGDSRGSRSQITWTVNVSDPAALYQLGKKMSDSFDKYPWGAKAYGLQTVLLGNQGWATHEVWAAFETPVEALNFLEKFYLTPEFQEYQNTAGDAAELVRSYMANSIIVSNED